MPLRPPVPLPLLLVAAVAGGWLARPAPRAPSARVPGDAGAHEAAALLSRPGATARVTAVVDGDTADLRLRGEDGRVRTARVRYLGVDAPESVHPRREVECGGPAAARANRRWATGRRVRLRFDRERVDPYGRLLAALVPVGARRSLSERLVAAGLARVLTIAPNGATAPRLLRLQRHARTLRRGIWGACPDAR